MKKLLLTGCDGMLGTALDYALSQRHDVCTLDRRQFDITLANWDRLSVEGFDYVINAAGLINRREEDASHFYIVNSVFPHVLAAQCARSDARLIHFSTDCVFDGVQAPFYEDSPRRAPDLYGTSKALGEPSLALVIRTSIIGPESRNFYNLLCWALAQQHINGFTNHVWNGVTTLELARLVNHIIEESLFVEGVRHIYSGDISKYELLKMICDIFGHQPHIAAASAPEPRDTTLRTRFPDFYNLLGIRSMEHQLTDLLPIAGPDGHWIKHRSAAP
ncbi:MAG: sugar nucleotide-binding protein [Alphaproteobacteria bacterium]|nr:sugar nucleotide-binding protein [Alphaproteobacteria bacterium]